MCPGTHSKEHCEGQEVALWESSGSREAEACGRKGKSCCPGAGRLQRAWPAQQGIPLVVPWKPWVTREAQDLGQGAISQCCYRSLPGSPGGEGVGQRSGGIPLGFEAVPDLCVLREENTEQGSRMRQMGCSVEAGERCGAAPLEVLGMGRSGEDSCQDLGGTPIQQLSSSCPVHKASPWACLPVPKRESLEPPPIHPPARTAEQAAG